MNGIGPSERGGVGVTVTAGFLGVYLYLPIAAQCAEMSLKHYLTIIPLGYSEIFSIRFL